MSGVNEPYCEYDGSESWARKKKGGVHKKLKTGLNNETYFCAQCVDCCLYSTTFIRGENSMPDCPLGKKPFWVQVVHSWIKSRMAFVLSELHDSFFKKLVKDSMNTSADVEPDEPDDSGGEDD